MTEDFLREEVRSGCTVSETTKRVWAVQLDLLERFMAVCEAHGLRFCAVFGTLLGAVRHGGFIPWDDDIDLAMPRADFERLRTLGPSVFSPPYFLSTPESDPGTPSIFLRLCNSNTTDATLVDLLCSYNKGCHIDILPIDGAPADKAARHRVQARARHLRRLIEAKARWSRWEDSFLPPGARRARRLGAAYDKAQLHGMLLENNTGCDAAQSGYFGIFGARRLCALPREGFAATELLPFEHLRIPAPAGRAALLAQVYGDVDLPEETERGGRGADSGVLDPDRGYPAYEAPFRGVFEKLGGRNVLLFGAGVAGADYLERHGSTHPAAAVFDNDPAKWGGRFHGVPVKNPAELPAMVRQGGAVLVASPRFYWSIVQQLTALGVTEHYGYVDGVADWAER